jgi:hypothetical protein
MVATPESPITARSTKAAMIAQSIAVCRCGIKRRPRTSLI